MSDNPSPPRPPEENQTGESDGDIAHEAVLRKLLSAQVTGSATAEPAQTAPAPDKAEYPTNICAAAPSGAVAGSETAPAQAPRLPTDFGLDDEHPMLAVPFGLQIDMRRLEGKRMSVTHLLVQNDEANPVEPGETFAARLQMRFDGFDLTVQAEVTVVQVHSDGTALLCFNDPTGSHLPQVRYVLNNTISGSLTTVNGLLAYTGPTRPKAPKAPDAPVTMRQRVRSLIVLALSGVLILGALAVLFTRMTTGREMYPVFLELSGQQMRATAPGQIGILNPDAERGDVVFSVNANTGDVLNFVMPCDCDFQIADNIEEGTTVLPSDLILTIFTNTSLMRARTMISVEGLARAMEGDKVNLDLNDGRSIPVNVVVSAATTEAAMDGGLFVPVDLDVPDGALSEADIGKSGRLRISANVLQRIGIQ